MSFSDEERQRYARHILLKEIGGPGQQRLKASHAAIIGVGGLGAPAALYLAAAGVGRLRLIDDDAVSLDNLQRQIIFRGTDVGASKVERARAVLAELNAHVDVDVERQRLTESNATYLLKGADIVLDGSDNFETRFAVNSGCRASGIPLVSGAVGRWEGQVSVFTRGGPCYRCLAPEAPPDAETCARVGVVGALTGVIGSMMALEAVKVISGAGEPLIGRLMIFDALGGDARVVKLARDPACPECGHE